MNSYARTLSLSLLVCSLVMLSGCWEKSEKSGVEHVSVESSDQVPAGDTSQVIVRMDGTPLLTVDMLEKEKERIFEAQPQMKAMLPFIDEKMLAQQLADGLVGQMLVNRYVEKQGINKTEKYKNDYEQLLKGIETNLNVQHIAEALDVAVSDADVQKYYDDHKDETEELMVSRGGVKAQGIQFDDEAKAKEFEDKLNAAGGDIDKVAKEMGLEEKLQDFKLVNEMSLAVDKTVKDAIMAIKDLPKTELVAAGDKDFWVVRATEREEKKYRDLQEVKEPLREMLVNEKKQEKLQEKLKALRDEYRIELDEEFFKPAEGSDQMQAMDDMSEEDIMAMLGDEDIDAGPTSDEL